MRTTMVTVKQKNAKAARVPLCRVHTLIIGSGAAGLNTAVQLHRRGITDLVIVTEGLEMGTSINTGSDKQTYYKMALYGADTDAPRLMAESYLVGGSMHGDIALIEASLSARAFLNLVDLGVPFPQDRYGQFVGYKTDHDPRQRATSIGPYTSREMCRALIREMKSRKIPCHEKKVAVSLLTVGEKDAKRAAGAVVLNSKGSLEVYAADNVVFATGGPGGLYRTSVYPVVHTGGIGIALRAGALARGLPESQYGLASTKFRWNVSGTYMQVIPRFISLDADGKGEPREFLRDYFESVGQMNSMVFLKGYQWPFDSRKMAGGSSIVDILVYIENVVRGRRVYLDFRHNPAGFDFGSLSEEARTYLTKSKALLETPLARLKTMNPGAIELYRDHGIDLAREPLEIAVCAQHNNGGLAANTWWESTNISHLFPVGEVNGSHGVYRPGGSALNSGQVGGIRAADYIAARYRGATLKMSDCKKTAASALVEWGEWLACCRVSKANWKKEREEMQARMSRSGAHIRDLQGIREALAEAWAQVERLETNGCAARKASDLIEAARNRQLCLAHAVYLEALKFAVESGIGSRGSAMVRDLQGQPVHPQLGPEWRFAPENTSFKAKVQETRLEGIGRVMNQWVACRPVPETEGWFETSWAAFRKGEIYN